MNLRELDHYKVVIVCMNSHDGASELGCCTECDKELIKYLLVINKSVRNKLDCQTRLSYERLSTEFPQKKKRLSTYLHHQDQLIQV